jgi:hypothetical protein
MREAFVYFKHHRFSPDIPINKTLWKNWTCRKNSLELIELSSVDKVILV